MNRPVMKPQRSARPRSAPTATPRDAPTARAEPLGAPHASLEFALLGLIAEGRAVSGYDIVKIFDLSMAHYWHAHHGQIYPTLERMRGWGWIERRDVIQRGRPNKRLYSVTDKGRRKLIEWLASRVEEMKLKIPSLLRCRFLGHLGPERAAAQIDAQRDAWERYLETYRGIEREFFLDPKGRVRYSDPNAMFAYFTLKFGIQFLEGNIGWCEWAVAEIERNRAHPSGGGAVESLRRTQRD